MNKTQFKKMLLSAAINPNEPGKIVVVFEANNPGYFVQRSIEALRMAQTDGTQSNSWHNNLKLATVLITMARLSKDNEKNQVPSKKEAALRTRVTNLAKKILASRHLTGDDTVITTAGQAYVDYNGISVPKVLVNSVRERVQQLEKDESTKDN